MAFFQSKKWIAVYMVSLILSLWGCQSPQQTQDVAIIPQPLSMEKRSGTFSFSKETTIAVGNEEQRIIAENFASLFTLPAGFTPQVKTSQEGDIVFLTDSTMKSDAYELAVLPERITMKAADAKGFFYALQNLRLMLPPAIEGKEKTTDTWSIPSLTIKDAP